jgi:hypothetical protein
LTTPKLEFASLSSTGGTVGELLNSAMDPTISFADLDVIRGIWPGKLVVKGVQSVEDAKKLAALGFDGIILSNHGGRQLDRAPIPFHLLPTVVREVGKDVEIGVDTGIMSGADIVASIALGAKFTMIGRAYLYGLMAGGRRFEFSWAPDVDARMQRRKAELPSTASFAVFMSPPFGLYTISQHAPAESMAGWDRYKRGASDNKGRISLSAATCS